MTNNQEEIVQLPITRYWTSQCKPTCVLHWPDKRCIFHRTNKMGQGDACAYTGEEIQREEVPDRGFTGFTIPCDNCPVWNNKGDK